MNFHQILAQRDGLLRQARLANVAFAFQRLGEFSDRITRARLRGLVTLRPGDPAGDHPWPTLVALEGSQAVIEEQFLDEDIVELADILAFLGDEAPATGLAFRLEELANRFMPPLRRELLAAGVALPLRSDAAPSSKVLPDS